MVESIAHQPSSSASWGQKLVALLALLAASVAFVVTVLAPLVMPFVPAEFRVMPNFEAIIDSFDDSPAERHRL